MSICTQITCHEWISIKIKPVNVFPSINKPVQTYMLVICITSSEGELSIRFTAPLTHWSHCSYGAPKQLTPSSFWPSSPTVPAATWWSCPHLHALSFFWTCEIVILKASNFHFDLFWSFDCITFHWVSPAVGRSSVSAPRHKSSCWWQIQSPETDCWILSALTMSLTNPTSVTFFAPEWR